jgi:hypothetical protein
MDPRRASGQVEPARSWLDSRTRCEVVNLACLADALLIAGKCYGCCLILRQSTPCPQSRRERSLALQHPVILAVTWDSHAMIAWHDTCIKGCCIRLRDRGGGVL